MWPSYRSSVRRQEVEPKCSNHGVEIVSRIIIPLPLRGRPIDVCAEADYRDSANSIDYGKVGRLSRSPGKMHNRPSKGAAFRDECCRLTEAP